MHRGRLHFPASPSSCSRNRAHCGRHILQQQQRALHPKLPSSRAASKHAHEIQVGQGIVIRPNIWQLVQPKPSTLHSNILLLRSLLTWRRGIPRVQRLRPVWHMLRHFGIKQPRSAAAEHQPAASPGSSKADVSPAKRVCEWGGVLRIRLPAKSPSH